MSPAYLPTTKADAVREYIARRHDPRFDPFPWDVHLKVRVIDDRTVEIVGLDIVPTYIGPKNTVVDQPEPIAGGLTGEDLARIPVAWLRELVSRNEAWLSAELTREPFTVESARRRGRPDMSDADLMRIATIYFRVRKQHKEGRWWPTLCVALQPIRDDTAPVPEGTVKHWLALCKKRGFTTGGRYPEPGPTFTQFQQTKKGRK